MKDRIPFLSALPLLLLMMACGQKTKVTDVVTLERTDSPGALLQAVQSIELIPLESRPGEIVGPGAELDTDGSSWILADKQPEPAVFRFDARGRFQNRIGHQGNGPGEYTTIQSTQLQDGRLTVFSMPDRILHSSLDGTLLSQENKEGLRLQSVCVPEGILTYRGYGAGSPARVDLLSEAGDKSFLESDVKLINMMPNGPVFTQEGPVTYFTDSYNPVIYAYEAGTVRPEVTFDFGKYALGERFYQFDDAFAAAEYMMSLPDGFAIIQRYLRGGDYQFVEAFIQQDMQTDACYGICRGREWTWFSLGKPGESPFAASLRLLDGDRLCCLLDAGLLCSADHGLGGPLAALGGKISNPEVLDGIQPEDNPVIAIIQLK